MDFVYCLRDVSEEWEPDKWMKVFVEEAAYLPVAMVKYGQKLRDARVEACSGSRLGSPLRVASYVRNITFLVYPFAPHLYSRDLQFSSGHHQAFPSSHFYLFLAFVLIAKCNVLFL